VSGGVGILHPADGDTRGGDKCVAIPARIHLIPERFVAFEFVTVRISVLSVHAAKPSRHD